MKYKTVYISGPLTNIDPAQGLKEIYEQMGQWLEEQGVKAYVPHLKGDPVLFPILTPKEIWDMDAAAVRSADLTIAYVGIPALGVGQELEIAREAGKSLIIWYFSGEKVTRMARGNPAIVAELEVADIAHLKSKLIELLTVGS
jgi:hypothetical protein